MYKNDFKSCMYIIRYYVGIHVYDISYEYIITDRRGVRNTVNLCTGI